MPQKQINGSKYNTFPGSWVLCTGRIKESLLNTDCSLMCQLPLVTCILLCYTKIMVYFCLPAGRPHCWAPCEANMGGFEVRNNIALMITVCIALFKAIGELQKEKTSVTCPSVQLGGPTRLRTCTELRVMHGNSRSTWQQLSKCISVPVLSCKLEPVGTPYSVLR